MYENIRAAIREVLDPATLANLVLLHWEGDENGGMDRFMSEAPGAELVGSALSIQLNAASFGVDTDAGPQLHGRRAPPSSASTRSVSSRPPTSTTGTR